MTQDRGVLALLVYCARPGTVTDRGGSGRDPTLGADLGGDATFDAVAAAITSWEDVVEAAGAHGLLPLLAQAARGSAVVPEDVGARLAAVRRGAAARSLRQSAELLRILAACGEAGLRVMPLKGPTLAQQVYGDLTLRQSDDLDLLVLPTQVEQAVAALRGMGYAAEVADHEGRPRYSLRSGQDLILNHAGMRTVVEVHWRPSRSRDGFGMTAERMFARAATVELLEREVLFPDWSDLFVYLAVHASAHGWARLEQLRSLGEIAVQQRAIDWMSVLRMARDMGASRRAHIAVLLIADVLGVAWDDRVLAEARADGGAARVAAAAASAWAPAGRSPVQPKPPSTTHAQFGPTLQCMRCQDGLRAKARYLLLKVIEPDELDWSAVTLPASLYPLYYLVRPARLAGLYLRRALSRVVKAGTPGDSPAGDGSSILATSNVPEPSGESGRRKDS